MVIRSPGVEQSWILIGSRPTLSAFPAILLGESGGTTTTAIFRKFAKFLTSPPGRSGECQAKSGSFWLSRSHRRWQQSRMEDANWPAISQVGVPAMTDSHQTNRVQHLINLAHNGDAAARDHLIAHFQEQLRRLVRRRLARFPKVRRWELTDDVLQDSYLSLRQALESVPISTPKEFLSLAAWKIRQLLLDHKKRLYGPEGMGRHHDTQAGQPEGCNLENRVADPSHSPAALAAKVDLEIAIDRLPPEEREVIDLIDFLGLGTADVAEILGETQRTVQRRWRRARRRLRQLLGSTTGDTESPET